MLRMSSSEIDNQNLPDLPGLESVVVKDNTTPVVLLLLGGFFCFVIGWCVWMYAQYHEYVPAMAVFMPAAAVIVCLFLIVHSLASYFRYKTDSEGFVAWGLLVRKIIKWNEVERMELGEDKYEEPTLTLITSNDKVRVKYRQLHGLEGFSKIVASAWQHLRRRGKVDNVELAPYILSLWQEIPAEAAELSNELEWGGAPGRGRKVWAIVKLAVPLGLALSPLIITPPREIIFGGYLLTMTLGWLVYLVAWLLPGTLSRAYYLKINAEGLEAFQLFSTTWLPWAEVKQAYWDRLRDSLIIKGNTRGQTISIPYQQGNEESVQLVLAVAHRLRLADTPQALMPLPLIKDRPLKRKKEPTPEQLFLETLPAPAQHSIVAVKMLQLLAFFSLPFLSAFAVMGNWFGRLAKHLFAGADTVYFFSGSELTTYSFILWIPMMFGIMFAGVWLISVIYSKFGRYKAEFQSYSKADSKQSRWDAFIMKFAIGIGILGLLGLLAMPVFMKSYLKVSNRGVVVSRLLQREHFYSWADIKNAEIREQSRSTLYTITLSDNSYWQVDSSWETGHGCRDSDTEADSALSFIAKKSGKPLQRVSIEEP